tara:strand:+ start:624 stop:899 length:276 start_codon:yes stop_codon:yes gene_type:complete
MQTYTKTYLTAYGLKDVSECYCDMCGDMGTSIHHIDNKGSGGSKHKDFLENLICVCLSCHELAHNNRKFNRDCKIKILEKVLDKVKREDKF